MFGKRVCGNCKEKVSDRYSYCPYCGYMFGKKKGDYGMLGASDEASEMNEVDSMFGGLGGNMLNRMFSNAMKMLEKEFEREFRGQNLQGVPKTNFEIIINGKRIDPNQIKFAQKILPGPDAMNSRSEAGPKTVKKKTPEMSVSSLKKMSKLPKKEPATSIRRLSNKVIYEIEIPGVNSIEDLSITKLENSIEIKALAKDRAYSKRIPLNLPILNYELSDGKLILELDAKT
jgi:HSP20 family molecular chaperone IbpA